MSQPILMALALSVILAHYIHAGQQDDLNDDNMLDLPEEFQDEILVDDLFNDLRVNRKSQLMHDSGATAIDSPEKKDGCIYAQDRAWTGELCRCFCQESWLERWWCYLENGGGDWRYCCLDNCIDGVCYSDRAYRIKNTGCSVSASQLGWGPGSGYPQY